MRAPITFPRRSARSTPHAILLAITLAASPSAFAETTPLPFTNPGAETGDTSGWTLGGTSNPAVDGGFFDPGISPEEGFKDFYGGTGASGSLSQTLSLSGYAPTFQQIDNNQVTYKASFYEQSLDQGANSSDTAGVQVTAIGSGSNVTFSTGEIASRGGWSPANITEPLSPSSRSLQYQMFFVRHSGNDLDAFIDNNALSLTYPGSSWKFSNSNTTFSWNDPANWNSGIPATDALLTHPGVGVTVNFDGDYSTTPLNNLFIDAGKQVMTLSQSANHMHATNEYVGNLHAAAYLQSGGTNTAGTLYLGYYAGSNGTYTISNGSLNASELHAGFGGAGALSISNNANVSISTLYVGESGSGNVSVSGGALSVGALRLYYGGAFNVSGGNVTLTSDTTLEAVHTIPFTLSGGSLSVPDLFFVPNSLFSWTAGNLTVRSNLSIDPASPFGPHLTLDNAKSLATRAFYVNSSADVHIYPGASLSVTSLDSFGLLVNDGSLSIGSDLSESGGTLTSTGAFSCAAQFVNYGNLTLAGPQSWTGAAYLDNKGNATLSSDAGSPTAAPLGIANDLTLHLQNTQHLQFLAIVNGTAFLDPGAAVKTNRLTNYQSNGSWTGTLSLANSTLVIEDPLTKSDSLASARQQVLYGLTHPTGIVAPSLPPHTAIAVLDNAVTHFTTFAGLSVDDNSILLTPELLGDANADGKVDLTDLSTLLNHFGQSTPNWTDGNFDYQPTINLTDLSYVLNNFGLSIPNPSQLPITIYQLPAPATPTPEPTTLAFLLSSTLLLPAKRRPRA